MTPVVSRLEVCLENPKHHFESMRAPLCLLQRYLRQPSCGTTQAPISGHGTGLGDADR